MISEHQFAASYSSVWDQITPLGDGYWHSENLLVERVQSPIRSKTATSLRGVVNEAGFRAFCTLRAGGGEIDAATVRSAVDAISSESIAYVDRFISAPTLEREPFDDSAREEAAVLARHLLEFFPGLLPTQVRPVFPGCGLISTCEGDVIEGDCLYEVKAGERSFRLIDLRQLLVYSALAYSAGTMRFTSIGLFNPRTGSAWCRTLDDVCESIAGTKAVDTLSTLVDSFSGASVSR